MLHEILTAYTPAQSHGAHNTSQQELNLKKKIMTHKSCAVLGADAEEEEKEAEEEEDPGTGGLLDTRDGAVMRVCEPR